TARVPAEKIAQSFPKLSLVWFAGVRGFARFLFENRSFAVKFQRTEYHPRYELSVPRAIASVPADEQRSLPLTVLTRKHL
ncbi:MAG TPA: hypothetical protein PLQ88_23470, partial [Blastocatellia bacterium]|nr:hypothetical protein [Blastocatellia bacterium]